MEPATEYSSDNSHETKEALCRLDARGAHFVLARADKSAIGQGWQKHRRTLDEVLRHLEEGGLVGVIPASLGCTVVDVDTGGEKALQGVRTLLGDPVGTVPSRGPERWHLWYRSADATVGNRKWLLPGGGSGEIFGSRGQVVLWNPPVLAEALEKHFDLAEPVSVKEVPPRPTKKTKQNARPTPDDQGVVGASPPGVEAVRTAVEGERNNVLNREAFAAAKRGERDFSQYRAAALDTGLDAEEVDRTILSASTAGASQSGSSFIPLTERPIFRKDSHGLAGVLAHLQIEIRYDDRLKIPDWRRVDGSIWQPFDDLWEAGFRELIRDRCCFRGSGGKPTPAHFGDQEWKSSLNSLLNRLRVDPFRVWLESRPPWTGQELLPRLFIDTLGAEDCLLVRETGKRWLIACIARTVNPGVKHDWMPVLVGPQGGGKSAVPQHLLPENDYGWHSDSADLDLPKKELIEATYAAVIVEFVEMAGAHRQDISKLKAFLSRYQDHIRMPWGHRREAIKRKWVAIGTANNDGSGVLPEDLSGSRRWIAIESPAREGNYDHVVSYLEENRDQLWAEALHRYHAGEGWDLPAELIPSRNAVNKVHTKSNDSLRDHLAQIRADTESGVGYRLDQLIDMTKLPPGRRGQNVLMPHIRDLGWTKHKGSDDVPRWFPPPKE